MNPPPLPSDPLIARLVTSPHAAAAIVSKRAEEARRHPGVVDVIFGEDLEPRNRLRPVRPEDPILAGEAVQYHGQPVALVVAGTAEAAAAAAALVDIQYHPEPAIVDIDHALALQSHHGDPVSIARGDAAGAIDQAPYQIEGSLEIGSQLPFDVSPLCAEAAFDEEHRLVVSVSAELPSRVRAAVAQALSEPESRIEVAPGRLSGLSGGRQSEAALVATLAALAAHRTKRAVRLEVSRPVDLSLSAKRHAVRAQFRAGHDGEGRLLGADVRLILDGGHEPGDSGAALDQALLHADGAYFIPHFRASGRLCRTHHVTGAALPAEGAAQGAFVMEEILTRIAHRLARPVDAVRELNLYREADHHHSTPFGQPVDCDPLHRVWTELKRQSDYSARRQAIETWNAGNPCYKRGIGIVPVKLGVGDPRSDRNQAAAQVQVLLDGSVNVHLGCADAGDGLAQRVGEEAAAQFGILPSQVSVSCGSAGVVPHFTARLGADAVGLLRRAVADACEAVKTRLRPVAAQLLAASGAVDIDAEAIRFAEGRVGGGGGGGRGPVTLSFSEVVETAWRRRTHLAASGFHRTPNLWWDRELGAGWPFSGFVCGAAAVEVQLDAFTGEIQILRVDVVHQGSQTAGAPQERAQISRALQMGLGWMLSEGVHWTGEGVLKQSIPGAYVTPGFADAPIRQAISLIPATRQPSEYAAASGAESAVILAAAAREAVREAVRAFGTPVNPAIEIDLPIPATPVAVLESLREMSRSLSDQGG